MHYKYIKEKTEINNRVAKIAESFQEMYELERIKEELLKKQEEINEALKSVSARSIQLRQNINQLVDGIDEAISDDTLLNVEIEEERPVRGQLKYVGDNDFIEEPLVWKELEDAEGRLIKRFASKTSTRRREGRSHLRNVK